MKNGMVSIHGFPWVGYVLTAILADPDFAGRDALFLGGFIWRADGMLCNNGVKSDTLELKPWHVGKCITAHIDYVDAAGNVENPTSAGYGPINNKWISTITQSHTTLNDSLVSGGWISSEYQEPIDGVVGAVDYQWKISGPNGMIDIAGAKSPKLIFTTDMIGKTVTHTAEWIDGTGAHNGRWYWSPGIVREPTRIVV